MAQLDAPKKDMQASPRGPEQRNAARRYVVVFLVTTLIFLAAASATIFWTWREIAGKQLPYVALWNYQVEKIQQRPQDNSVKWVFVGDSSLGNGIDANLWSNLAAAPSMNLALTGNFGFAGPYNLLRRIDDSLLAPQPCIVMMHQYSMLAFDRHDDIFQITSPDPEFSLVRLLALFRERVSFDALVRVAAQAMGLRSDTPDVDHIDPKIDYMAQHPPGVHSDIVAPSVRELEFKNLRYLREIKQLCIERGWRCIYMHGPVVTSICNSDAYFDKANDGLRAAGIEIGADRPYCIKNDEWGDTSTHIGPHAKQNSTQWYFNVLRNSCRG